jgi:hypothetical protein
MRPHKRTRPFTRKITTSVRRDEGSYLVEVMLRCHPGDPGRTYGEPYDCYPPEPAYGEVEDILVVDIEDDGDKNLVGQHVDWEIDIEELVACALEAQDSEDEASYEEYCERKMDAMREGD